MKTVGIIPARGGSKGLPGKNILPFCGKPLIAWTIEQARATEGIDSVWVTSDSDEILKVASDYGARPILRPPELSGDAASSESAWLHAAGVIEKEENSPVDLIVALQATSPLRYAKDITEGLRVYSEQKLDSLFSASLADDLLLWSEGDGELVTLNYDFKNRGQRQNRKKQIIENGSFYIFRPGDLLKHNNRLSGKIGYCMMEFFQAFEIDDLEGFNVCMNLMDTFILKKAR